MATLAATSVIPLYAGFWRRGAASVIDGLVLFIPSAVIGFVLGSGLAGFLAQLALNAVYYAAMHSSQGQATVGKKAFGIKVTGVDGERIGFGRALGRYFGVVLSVLLLGIGLLMAAFTGRKQALHDMLCGTLVVNREATPEQVVAGGDTMPVTAGVWAVVTILFIVPFFGGILAAIAIPAYHDYTIRAKVMNVVAATPPLRREVEQAAAEKRAWRTGTVELDSKFARAAEITRDGRVIVTLADDVVRDGRVVWTPEESGGAVSWKCSGDNVPPKYLPPQCRP